MAHWEWVGPGPAHNPRIVKPNGLRDLASVFYPRIGPYDSGDEMVLDYHILSAKLAGIEDLAVELAAGLRRPRSRSRARWPLGESGQSPHRPDH